MASFAQVDARAAQRPAHIASPSPNMIVCRELSEIRLPEATTDVSPVSSNPPFVNTSAANDFVSFHWL